MRIASKNPKPGLTPFAFRFGARSANAITSGAVESDFGFTGDYYNATVGLDLTLYRAYNPVLGRWLNRDPLGESGGLNLYGYVGSNPINRLDMFGLEPLDSSTSRTLQRYFNNNEDPASWDSSKLAGVPTDQLQKASKVFKDKADEFDNNSKPGGKFFGDDAKCQMQNKYSKLFRNRSSALDKEIAKRNNRADIEASNQAIYSSSGAPLNSAAQLHNILLGDGAGTGDVPGFVNPPFPNMSLPATGALRFPVPALAP